MGKRVFLVVIMLVLLVLSIKSSNLASAAPPNDIHPIMGGGTAVLFDNGDLYNLTLSGWKKSGHLPPGLLIKNVRVVLTSDRIVESDGTGWVQSNGEWTRLQSPVR